MRFYNASGNQLKFNSDLLLTVCHNIHFKEQDCDSIKRSEMLLTTLLRDFLGLIGTSIFLDEKVNP